MRNLVSSLNLLIPMLLGATIPADADSWKILEDRGPITLQITSTLMEGAITQTQLQTAQFTFDSLVTGFDAGDVTVTGATKGSFTSISPSNYSLEVIATGGTVTISVQDNAAEPVAGNRSILGDSYSNFYQDTWVINLLGNVPMELIRIPAGTFIMGSPLSELHRGEDETEHLVTISQDFYLGKTEVTQEQWLALQPFPVPYSTVGDSVPMYGVTWDEIQGWLTVLNMTTMGSGIFRLPTESQWEYACRAGTSTRFNFGDAFEHGDDPLESYPSENMWYLENSNGTKPKNVGQKRPNPWGLYDMHGNVQEWCDDLYGTYPTTPTIDPTGPTVGVDRIFRGGDTISFLSFCGSARRSFFRPDFRLNTNGFRVHATLPHEGK